MAITARAKQTLKSELSRLEKERAAIDKDIRALRESLKTLGDKAAPARRGRKPGRPKAGAKKGRARNTKLSPRAEKALKMIKAKPGITGAELAKNLKLSHQTSIYPVINRLKKDKLIKKSGKGFAAA